MKPYFSQQCTYVLDLYIYPEELVFKGGIGGTIEETRSQMLLML